MIRKSSKIKQQNETVPATITENPATTTGLLELKTEPIKKTNKPRKITVTTGTTKTKSKTNGLSISEKRKLAHELIRTVQKNGIVLDRVIKLIISRNSLQSATKQDLTYGLEVNTNNNTSTLKVAFISNVPDPLIYNDLKKNIKDIEVVPYTNPSPKQIGFYVKIKQPTGTNKTKRTSK